MKGRLDMTSARECGYNTRLAVSLRDHAPLILLCNAALIRKQLREIKQKAKSATIRGRIRQSLLHLIFRSSVCYVCNASDLKNWNPFDTIDS